MTTFLVTECCGFPTCGRRPRQQRHRWMGRRQARLLRAARRQRHDAHVVRRFLPVSGRQPEVVRLRCAWKQVTDSPSPTRVGQSQMNYSIILSFVALQKRGNKDEFETCQYPQSLARVVRRVDGSVGICRVCEQSHVGVELRKHRLHHIRQYGQSDLLQSHVEGESLEHGDDDRR